MTCVLTIGNFDGVHLGHGALLDRARHVADQSGGPRPVVTALVFDPHPAQTLRPAAAPPRLSTFEQREKWLRQGGADQVIRLEPTPQLLALSPAEFIAKVVTEHKPVAMVEGRDFRFGRGRAGGVDTLAELGRTHGFRTEVVEPVTAVLSDHSQVTVSSTLVRWLVQQGRVRDAAALLGRPYTIAGTVVQGDRRGRTIGFPTANIDTPCLLPADGVYAGRAWLPGRGQQSSKAAKQQSSKLEPDLRGLSRCIPAAVHVGERPTFQGAAPTLEAFLLLDQPGGDGNGQWAPIPGLPEYGWTIELEIVAWLRDQIRFESIEALVAQMRGDCDRAAAIVQAQQHAHKSAEAMA